MKATAAPTFSPTAKSSLKATPAKLATTVKGPAISLASIAWAAVAKYGKGTKITEYEQKSSLSLQGLPGAVTDYKTSNSVTIAQLAKQYTVERGATKPLGLQPSAWEAGPTDFRHQRGHTVCAFCF